MEQFKILLLFALIVCTFAWGGEQRGPQGRELMNGWGRGGRSSPGGPNQEFGGFQGMNGGQLFRGQNDRKYRSNLYNDDDVYGYDATYPNGEAAYVNYRSKDARMRRGPEFARTSRAYRRQGESNFGQMNKYSGGGGASGMW